MIHLSSYHSNGLPTVVWSNKVNLIGEKVYKPKIHFCEYCNKPILIYGRLIPCKHVFCFTCATLCLIQQQPCSNNNNSNSSVTNLLDPTSAPLLPGPNEPIIQSPLRTTTHHQSPRTGQNNNNGNVYNSNHKSNDNRDHQHPTAHSRNQTIAIDGTNYNDCKNIDLHQSDSNHSLSHRGSYSGSVIMDESTSNTTPNRVQNDLTNSPNINGSVSSQLGPTLGYGPLNGGGPLSSKGCHWCGNRVLRVERNTLNSIFVCQIDTCRRTYLSARDLQAHFNHRHSRNKGNYNSHTGSSRATGASMAAISSSPYISSSSLLHLSQNNNDQSSSNTNNHNHYSDNSYKQSIPSTSRKDDNGIIDNQNQPSSPPPLPSSPNSANHNQQQQHHRPQPTSKRPHGRQGKGNHPHAPPDRSNNRQNSHNRKDRDRMARERDRFKERESDQYQKERERERNSKEYHRQSLQRAAQWAEASAQIMEKGLTR